MREIKFRAWNVEKEAWVLFIGALPFIPNAPFSIMDITPMDDRVILEQFTGMEDKKGRDIYEGDILESPSFRCYKPTRGVMSWDDGNAAWAKFWPINEFEVVGNIHENPELLK